MHRYLRAWGERGKGQQFRAKLVNYADDFVILSCGHAQEALEWTRWAMGKIGLTLNEEKTCLRNARRESFTFLGYTFGPMISPKTGHPYLGAAPSREAIQGLREQVPDNPPSEQHGSPGRSSEAAQSDSHGLAELLRLRESVTGLCSSELVRAGAHAVLSAAAP
jgi:hypothetical protein